MSIVPMDYWRQPDLHSKFMRDLVQAELVVQISPAQYIYRTPDFEDAFIKHIERHFLGRRTGTESNHKLIHVEKLGRLPSFLEQNRLASPKEGPWYFVRADVAEHFMAYLASVLAKQEELSASPVTFEQNSVQLFRKDSKGVHSFPPQKYQVLRDLILRKLLPVPMQEVSIDDLVGFKAQYGHLLPPFRNYVERNIIRLSQLQKRDERNYAVELFLEEAQANSQELVEAMKFRWRDITFGMLMPILGAGISGIAAQNTLGVAGVVTSLVGAIQQAVASMPNNRQASMSEPMAYVAHMYRQSV